MIATASAPTRATTTEPARDLPTAIALIAGPVLIGGYGLIRLNPAAHGPGAAWICGHGLLLAGLLAFGRVFWALGGLIPAHTTGRRVLARAVTAIAYAGLAGSLGQVAIDLYVGSTQPDLAAMNHLFAQIQSHSGVMPACYTVLPLFFFISMINLTAMLAAMRPRRMNALSPVLTVIGVILGAAGLDYLPLTAACFLVALAPLARTLR